MVTGIVTGLLCLAAWLTWLGNRRVRFTTLKTAARWGLAAVAVWLTAWVWDRFATGYRQPWGDFLWYLAGLTTISMFVAVLGAKRPGVRAWPWFVLLPLVTVFSLPVIAAAWPFSHGTSVRVPLPLMIGFAVVLLMGAGNYVGTRYSMAAALSAVAVCLVVAPLSDAAPVSLFLLGDPRVVGSICFSSAVIVAYRQSLRPTIGHTPVERLWFDYRDTFGIVWARRLLDRVNQRADAEMWCWRLGDDGLHPATQGDHSTCDPSVLADADSRIEHTFRWLLRRFVDPEWIDLRITPPRPTRGESEHSETAVPGDESR